MSVRFSVLLICVVLAAPLQTGEVGINKPTLGKVALDCCRVWGKECGKPAADAYCKPRGYLSAI